MRPVTGSLVQLRLPSSASRPGGSRHPGRDDSLSANWGRGVRRRPGLNDFLSACSVARSGQTAGDIQFSCFAESENMV